MPDRIVETPGIELPTIERPPPPTRITLQGEGRTASEEIIFGRGNPAPLYAHELLEYLRETKTGPILEALRQHLSENAERRAAVQSLLDDLKSISPRDIVPK